MLSLSSWMMLRLLPGLLRIPGWTGTFHADVLHLEGAGPFLTKLLICNKNIKRFFFSKSFLTDRNKSNFTYKTGTEGTGESSKLCLHKSLPPKHYTPLSKNFMSFLLASQAGISSPSALTALYGISDFQRKRN